jgi:tripartite-type tricarboxylate transporter receptor subunit TctC
MKIARSARPFACLTVIATLATLPAIATAAEKVTFAGQRIEAMVPFPPAGGTDVYMRALVPFLEKHLPGNPTIIVRNVPGGGSIPGANQFQARAKPDGTHVLAASASTVMNYVFQPGKMQFELEKAEPIIVSPQGAVVYVAGNLGVAKPEDIVKLRDRALLYGGQTPTGGDLRITTSFDLLGLNVKRVWGLARGPARLAFERGEFNINYDTTPAYMKNVLPLVKAGKAVPIYTSGIVDEQGNIVRDPNFPDIQTVPEAYERLHGRKPSGAAFEAWRAVVQMGIMANKALMLPVGTPSHIVEAWRNAVRNMLKDPEFQKHAETITEGYPQFVGEAARPIIKEATALTPEVREWLANYLKGGGDGK